MCFVWPRAVDVEGDAGLKGSLCFGELCKSGARQVRSKPHSQKLATEGPLLKNLFSFWFNTLSYQSFCSQQRDLCIPFSLLLNKLAESAHCSQPLPASIYPFVTNFTLWEPRHLYGEEEEMGGKWDTNEELLFLYFNRWPECQQQPISKTQLAEETQWSDAAGPWTRLNRDNQHGSILTPSQLVPTGSHSSKPGLLGWPGRQMEMIWAHPVWPEFDPLGKIWKRKEGEKRRQTDSLKNYAYRKLDI